MGPGAPVLRPGAVALRRLLPAALAAGVLWACGEGGLLVGTGTAGGGPEWRAVSAGDGFTCGLAGSGEAYCWGENRAGVLGVGSRDGEVYPSPAPVRGALRFREVDAGRDHVCAVAETGRAYCWGEGRDGRLGALDVDLVTCRSGGETRPCSLVPAPVAGNLRFRGISAGGAHTCGVTESLDLYCWGSNEFGQLGIGALGGERTTPRLVSRGVSRVAAGGDHTCALLPLGGSTDLFCWGDNRFGQLGDGTRIIKTFIPAEPVVRGASGVAAGFRHGCLLAPAECWGEGDEGQLGTGNALDALVPVRVAGEPDLVSLSAGRAHTCGVGAGGTARCWGRAAEGQVGIAEAGEIVPEPAEVAGGLVFDRVSAGGLHTCGVTAAGEAFCWGDNRSGQLGDGTTVGRETPTEVGPPPPRADGAAAAAVDQPPRASRTRAYRSSERRKPRLLM